MATRKTSKKAANNARMIDARLRELVNRGDSADPYAWRYHWVYPNMPDHQRTKEKYPYSYSAHFLFGDHETIKGCHSQYSDRLFQQDPRAREIWNRVCGRGQYWSRVDPERITEFMSEIVGYKTEVKALAEECHVGNGYPLWIVWFTPKE